MSVLPHLVLTPVFTPPDNPADRHHLRQAFDYFSRAAGVSDQTRGNALIEAIRTRAYVVWVYAPQQCVRKLCHDFIARVTEYCRQAARDSATIQAGITAVQQELETANILLQLKTS